MGIGNLYQVVLKQRYAQQNWLYNVFYYRQEVDLSSLPDTPAQYLNSAFWFLFQPLLYDIQVTSLRYDSLHVTNVSNALGDFYVSSFPSSYGGVNTGQGAPPFVAAKYMQPSVTRSYHNGYKRIGGLSEADVYFNNVESGSVGRFNDLADAMSTTLDANVSFTEVFRPCIVRKTPSGGSTAYTWLYWANAWVFDGITSQSSRRNP